MYIGGSEVSTELLAKHLHASLMIVRGHQGVAEAAWEKLIKKITKSSKDYLKTIIIS